MEKKDVEDYEENEAMKKGRIPKFSRKDSVLCNLYPRYTRYCSFYLNYDDIKDIPGEFKKRDLIEFVFFLKKKELKFFCIFIISRKKRKKKKKKTKETKKR